jgi:hypothetical protein
VGRHNGGAAADWGDVCTTGEPRIGGGDGRRLSSLARVEIEIPDGAGLV